MMETTSVVLVGFRDRHEIKQEGFERVCTVLVLVSPM
jgi:hypothetical protein